jgi:SAM-dependent methyltransferase
MMPPGVMRVWRRKQLQRIRRDNAGRNVAEIFAEIYRNNRWGGARGRYHSGSGSSGEHAQVYAQAVTAFIKSHDIHRVVDLGCGDFRVGAQLATSDILYTGVDIVPDLVRKNRARFASERVRFECLNIIEEELPEADLCLIRQVLQHLSNQQISRVLTNVEKYRYVLVTEHYPASAALRHKNIDKPCGEDVRVYDGSAVFLDAPPFNRQVSRPVLDVDATRYLVTPGERIRTYLLENRVSAAVPPSAPAFGA